MTSASFLLRLIVDPSFPTAKSLQNRKEFCEKQYLAAAGGERPSRARRAQP